MERWQWSTGWSHGAVWCNVVCGHKCMRFIKPSVSSVETRQRGLELEVDYLSGKVRNPFGWHGVVSIIG